MKTSLRLVFKRLLGYGGLWEGKRMEGRRGESEGKLENCSGSGRGCCGKRWAGMGQETEAVLGVLRRRMGREGTGDRNVPKGGGGVWRAGGPSAPRPCQTKAGGRGPSGPLPPLYARCARPPPPRGAAKIGSPFIRGRRNGRRRYGRGHGNHGPPRGHGRDGRTGPGGHRPAARPTDPLPPGPRPPSRRRTG